MDRSKVTRGLPHSRIAYFARAAEHIRCETVVKLKCLFYRQLSTRLVHADRQELEGLADTVSGVETYLLCRLQAEAWKTR